MFKRVSICVFSCLCFIHLPGQEVSFESGWSVGFGLVYSNLRSTLHAEYSESEALLVQDLKNYGPKTGWNLTLNRYVRFNRQWGITSEISLLHSRRSGLLNESLSRDQLIYTQSGDLNFNNLYLQLLVAPRVQFGMFNRFYASLGPYIDYNLWNFSSFKGYRVDYAKAEYLNGNLKYVPLDQPATTNASKNERMRQTDFGGSLMFGTLLSLPGNDLLQIELRYSRGAFRMSQIPGVRQNRFLIVFSYTRVEKIPGSYKKYLPYL